MTIRRFIDPVSGHVAVYEVPTDVGDPDDPLAPCNAPLSNPVHNMSHVYFHSAFDPMEVAVDATDVVVSHLAIPAGSGGGGAATVNNGRVYGNVTRTHDLLAHDLGYVPDFFLLLGSNVVHPGFPVQFDSADGRARVVTAYATASKIMLHEIGVQTTTPLAAISVTYTVMVLLRPPAPINNTLFDYDPETDIVRMAGDRFRSDRRYLQVVDGGTPFGIPTGRTADFNNGTFRSVAPDGTIRDIVPATFRVSFGQGGPAWGPDGNYKGSFTGDPSVLVQAP